MALKNDKLQKVSLGEKVGYSLGDVAANLVFQMMVIFQLKFYTDVFGLDGAVAGSVLLIASLSAIVIDPLIGIMADRTNTRWGKFRPWILWTAIPFCLFYVLAFYNPGIEEKGMVATYATISYLLLMTVYSFNNIPYTSLGGVMTSDIKERTNITTIRFVAVIIAQFFVQGLTLPLVDHFGNNGENLQHGWVCTIGIFSVIAFVFFMIAFAVSKERIQPPPNQTMSFKEDVRQIARDAGIPVAEKSDSQELCFVEDGCYPEYVTQRAKEVFADSYDRIAARLSAGHFVDTQGNVLGEHKGIIHYTIGQRKGLGLAFGHPVYVKEIRPETNEVVLSEEEELFTKKVICTDLNFLSIPDLPAGEELPAKAKIRYRHGGEKAVLQRLEDGNLKILFEEPVRASTPGQSAVFYDEEGYVIGGGVIVE